MSSSTERTFVGHPTGGPVLSEVPRPASGFERTLLGRVDVSGERVMVQDHGGCPRFTSDMMAQLRAKLRAAEQAEEDEASGIFPSASVEPARNDAAAVEPPPEPSPMLESAEVPIERPRPARETISPDLVASFGALSLDEADSLLQERAPATELDELVAALPELEVSLAPNSESNFYAGFDEEHPDGVFLATYERLEEGTPVYLDVVLPAGYGFRTPATVEWVRDASDDPELPCGLGLRMCGLDDSMRRLIRAYARHRKPLFWLG